MSLWNIAGMLHSLNSKIDIQRVQSAFKVQLYAYNSRLSEPDGTLMLSQTF